MLLPDGAPREGRDVGGLTDQPIRSDVASRQQELLEYTDALAWAQAEFLTDGEADSVAEFLAAGYGRWLGRIEVIDRSTGYWDVWPQTDAAGGLWLLNREPGYRLPFRVAASIWPSRGRSSADDDATGHSESSAGDGTGWDHPYGFPVFDPGRAWRVVAEVADAAALRGTTGLHVYNRRPGEPEARQFLVAGLQDPRLVRIDRWMRRVVEVLAGREGPFDFYGFDFIYLDLAHDLALYQGELMTEGQARDLAAWLEANHGGPLASVRPERVEYVDPDGFVSVHDSGPSWLLHRDHAWSLPFLAAATTYSVQLAPPDSGSDGRV